MHVIDTNVFIHGSELELPFDAMITVPEVTSEIESEQAKQRFEATAVDLREPDEDAVSSVEAAAEQAGEQLSSTDTRLIALALQHDATLVTDDYGMQNIARQLDIAVEPFLKDGIEDSIDWTSVCGNCGRELEQDTCPVCGGDARKVSD